MAGVIRFKSRDNDIDLNTIKKDSWDFVGVDNLNKPSGVPTELAFVHTKQVGGNYFIQWYYGWELGSNYVRKFHSGLWQPWEKL